MGWVQYALKLHDEMCRRGCHPDVITYTELIKGYCMKGNFKEARDIFAKIWTSGLQVDGVPCKILINKYCRKGDLQSSIGLFESLLNG